MCFTINPAAYKTKNYQYYNWKLSIGCSFLYSEPQEFKLISQFWILQFLDFPLLVKMDQYIEKKTMKSQQLQNTVQLLCVQSKSKSQPQTQRLEKIDNKPDINQLISFKITSFFQPFQIQMQQHQKNLKNSISQAENQIQTKIQFDNKQQNQMTLQKKCQSFQSLLKVYRVYHFTKNSIAFLQHQQFKFKKFLRIQEYLVKNFSQLQSLHPYCPQCWSLLKETTITFQAQIKFFYNSMEIYKLNCNQYHSQHYSLILIQLQSSTRQFESRLTQILNNQHVCIHIIKLVKDNEIKVLNQQTQQIKKMEKYEQKKITQKSNVQAKQQSEQDMFNLPSHSGYTQSSQSQNHVLSISSNNSQTVAQLSIDNISIDSAQTHT